MLSSKNDDGSKIGTKSGHEENARRGSVLNRRTGLSAALNVPIRTPKPQSLPSYLVKVLLSLVQARLEAQVTVSNSRVACSSCGCFDPYLEIDDRARIPRHVHRVPYPSVSLLRAAEVSLRVKRVFHPQFATFAFWVLLGYSRCLLCGKREF